MLDQALRAYINRLQSENPRCHVIGSFAFSLDEFDTLYRELAKSAVPWDCQTVADLRGVLAVLVQRYGGAPLACASRRPWRPLCSGLKPITSRASRGSRQHYSKA